MIMSQSTTLLPYGETRIGILPMLGIAMKRVHAAYIARRVQSAASACLHRMSDRDLRDIGLTRGEIDDAVRGNAPRIRAFASEC
jgi:uncharacterized protein DUF1127